MTTIDDLTREMKTKKVKFNEEELVDYLLDYGNEFCKLFMTTPKQNPEFLYSAMGYKVRELYTGVQQLPPQPPKNEVELRFYRVHIPHVVRQDYGAIRLQQKARDFISD